MTNWQTLDHHHYHYRDAGGDDDDALNPQTPINPTPQMQTAMLPNSTATLSFRAVGRMNQRHLKV